MKETRLRRESAKRFKRLKKKEATAKIGASIITAIYYLLKLFLLLKHYAVQAIRAGRPLGDYLFLVYQRSL